MEHKLEEKTFPFEVTSINDEGEFEGYASVFVKPDALEEVVEPGAFTKTLKERSTRPILWYHNPAEPIGLTGLVVDGKGLKVKGQLNLEVQSAREKRSLMKQKAIQGLSIGFKTIKEGVREGRRILKEIKLYEVSLCTFQAHPDALVSSIKSENIDTIPRPKPPTGTRVEGKSIFSSVIEGLEAKNKPHEHLFGFVVELFGK